MSLVRRVSITPRIKGSWSKLLPPNEQNLPAGSSHQSVETWKRSNDIPKPIKDLLIQGKEWEGAQLLHAVLEHQCRLKGVGKCSIPDAVAICRLESGLGIIVSEAKKGEPFGRKVVKFDGSEESGHTPGDTALIAQIGLNKYQGSALAVQLLHRISNTISLANDYKADQACFIVHSFAEYHKGLSAFQKFAAAMGWNGLERNQLSSPKLVSGINLRIGWASHW